MLNYVFGSNGEIVVFFDNDSHTVTREHPRHREIVEAIQSGETDRLRELVDVAASVKDYISASQNLRIENGHVFYRRDKVDLRVTRWLLGLMRDGQPFAPTANMVERLLHNPSHSCVEGLHRFLYDERVRQPLPILPDGRFLGYKRVTDEFMDFYSKTVYYEPIHLKYQHHPQVSDPGWLDTQPGTYVSCPRWAVDDDQRAECSTGYHVGHWEYVDGFHTGEGHILAVIVDPAHVVVTPSEGSQYKIRTHALEVRHVVDERILDRVFNRVPDARATVPTSYEPPEIEYEEGL